MAILDGENTPALNQSVVGASATYRSTDVIDLKAANKNIGIGKPIRAVAQMTEALAGSTNIKAELIESANADLSSPTVLVSGAVVLTAAAIAGKRLLDVIVPGTSKRYLGFQFITTGAGAATTGKVTAFLTETVDHANLLPHNTGR